MTDSEDIAALRQEVENWKLIVIEQGRRLDIIAKRLDTPIGDEQPHDYPLVPKEADLWLVKSRTGFLERFVDDIWGVLTWVEARLVTIEKQPGIVPKKGWIEAKTLSSGTVDDDILDRMRAAMKNIDPN